MLFSIKRVEFGHKEGKQIFTEEINKDNMFGILIFILIVGIMLIFAILQKSNLIEIATLFMALGTLILAFIAFNQYLIEARPKVFIAEISPKSTTEHIIYTLTNTGMGTAQNAYIYFDVEAIFLDDKKSPIETLKKAIDPADHMKHIYPKQSIVQFFSAELTQRAKQIGKSYILNIAYKIKYEGRLFYLIKKGYEETGKFVYHSASNTWMIYPR